MAINRWRCVQGTDDGCVKYQCLSCYKDWEGRTSPEYNKWQFCPYCGTRWEGKQECVEHNYKHYYPDRTTAYNPYPDGFWVIEKRHHGGWEDSTWSDWHAERILDGRHPAAAVSRMLKEVRAEAKSFDDDWDTIKPQTEFRVERRHTAPLSHVWRYYGER